MLRELPNVKAKDGEKAAEAQYADVVGRCTFSKILINDTSGKMAMLTMADPRNPLDFGEDVKKKADELDEVLP